MSTGFIEVLCLLIVKAHWLDLFQGSYSVVETSMVGLYANQRGSFERHLVERDDGVIKHT